MNVIDWRGHIMIPNPMLFLHFVLFFSIFFSSGDVVGCYIGILSIDLNSYIFLRVEFRNFPRWCSDFILYQSVSKIWS